ncbi:MAG: DUF6382 domain-containing protein [Eubacteriales bacterium]|nr:DUF6382 domain-containing protein [Eubacteriales bacterium]
MKSEYKRDMNHNYLILTGEDVIDTDSYQVRMIVANAVPDLLQCRIQGIDGKFMVYYDVTSRHSLTALFEDRKLGIEDLQIILGGFIQVMEEMSEYLLNPCQLILEPEYIYMDSEKKNVRFCYLPGFHGEVQKQFQNLAEYFLPKLDHEDGKAVMLGYGVYRRALEDSFHLEHIKEELYKVREGKESDFMDYEKKIVQQPEQIDSGKEEQQKELWESGSWERESNVNSEKKTQKRRSEKKDKTKKTKDVKIWKSVAGFAGALLILLGITTGMAGGYLPRVSTEILLGVILLLMVLGMLVYILLKKVSGNEQKKSDIEEKVQSTDERYNRQKEMMWQTCEAGEKKNRMEEATVAGEGITEKRNPVSEKLIKDVEKRKKTEEVSEGFGETMVLSSGAVKGPATLVSREPGELATIYLDQDITVIGKLKTAADAVINVPTVSRIHAKIRRRDGEYYLTDLNSRNGTSVNGQMLKTGEDYFLKDEDEVDFAQARYIFLK